MWEGMHTLTLREATSDGDSVTVGGNDIRVEVDDDGDVDSQHGVVGRLSYGPLVGGTVGLIRVKERYAFAEGIVGWPHGPALVERVDGGRLPENVPNGTLLRVRAA